MGKLTSCGDCGHQISRKAKTCPGCGAPNKPTRKQYGCGSVLGPLIVIGLIIWGFSHLDSGSPTSPRTTPSSRSVRRTASADQSNPILPPYEVISNELTPPYKRSVSVRLSRRLTKRELALLALLAKEVKASDSSQYQRTFILHYLPGMVLNSGAWATTHYNPKLEVKISGLTIEALEGAKKGAAAERGKVLGCWLDLTPFAGGVLIVVARDGRMFVAQYINEGPPMITEVVEERSGKRRTLRTVGMKPSEPQDYWVINEAGELEIRDEAGIIATAKPYGGSLKA